MSDESPAHQNARPFNPIAAPSRYLYEMVAEHLADRIAAGDLRRTDPLPAEGHLAAQYDVSLGTVRQATRLLRERGLVVTVRSKGTYVASSGQRQETRESERSAEVPRRIIEGVDLAGTSAPVSIERRVTAAGPAVQMRVESGGAVVLSEKLVDDLKRARAHLLSNDYDESDQKW
ncbi:GntR family transcriptional regulator [Amycolatopsis sp. K13G38]|uniref:GntR family transcriptional regulator n=1 Tax=Amycolatopsis acididurans TaxID=2724524 RepID=A0ABX1IWW4_9PSEU|nr:GntR family transcriptional regulator [Amycolatopsis acididurans]NKQ51972.1 GntR family transcriptional regulator [Amycolatopsis acididurans]